MDLNSFCLKIKSLTQNTITNYQNSLLYLEVKVGVLSSGYLVFIDISVARFHGGSAVKWRIQASGHLPIFTVVKHLLQSNACNRAEQNIKSVSPCTSTVTRN